MIFTPSEAYNMFYKDMALKEFIGKKMIQSLTSFILLFIWGARKTKKSNKIRQSKNQKIKNQ